MGMDGTESESVGLKIRDSFGGSITPVVKHNTKSACKIQHPGFAA
jgi:hypothetical protein